MVAHATEPEAEDLGSRLDAALSSLESALAQASRAAMDIRNVLPQLVGLAEIVGEMEAAMSRARERLGVPPGDVPPPAVAPPTLRAVPTAEAPAQPEAPTQPEPAQPTPTQVEPAEAAPVVAVSEDETEQSRPGSHCLRLDVTLQSGSLDLKAVDSSVGECPAVVDVALLDYDGRHATLKVWIDESADAESVSATLVESLRSHLGNGENAEVSVGLDQPEEEPLF